MHQGNIKKEDRNQTFTLEKKKRKKKVSTSSKSIKIFVWSELELHGEELHGQDKMEVDMIRASHLADLTAL